ncbi:hypothetical protein P9B03_16750 [Metasolibacillus meyeri]|uniref:Uncharacterized protein n=1 Tax=Metasolibacillus meyeri TaxID=1071052 RepID=A0AAW9NMU6_9BACL|nr:hypothetical protein [Metasolibacillus meyeri]MEC1180154.1 hypothetical protein [Metasolibacillus meyeri]
MSNTTNGTNQNNVQGNSVSNSVAISNTTTQQWNQVCLNFLTAIAPLSWIETVGVLKKFQRIDFQDLKELDFKKAQKNVKQEFTALLERNLGICYEPTIQKIINNILIASKLNHYQSKTTLLDDIISNKGNMRVYLGSYR